MLARAVLRVQDINPMLFVYVQELNQVKVGRTGQPPTAVPVLFGTRLF